MIILIYSFQIPDITHNTQTQNENDHSYKLIVGITHRHNTQTHNKHTYIQKGYKTEMS